MKCLLCGKNYINLGVHLRHKHHADPSDYKEQFGLMKILKDKIKLFLVALYGAAYGITTLLLTISFY